jgi:hypothetical protein
MRIHEAEFRRTVLAVVLFAVAMGYVEAAVVVDLRAALGLAAAPTFPLTEAGPAARLAWIEIGREVATLVMLVSVGLLIGRRGWAWLAWTAVAFGVWDITYYGWLAVFIGWPTSLLDFDLLFLIPVPWVGPVWAPVVVSLALIAVGLLAGRRYALGRDPVVERRHIAAAVLGGAIVLVSFMADAPGILAGQMPGWFPWPLFLAGVLIATLAAYDVLRADASPLSVEPAATPSQNSTAARS